MRASIILCFLFFSLPLYASLPIASAGESATDHSTQLSGQVLRPGDVINFYGGGVHANIGRPGKYGHTSLYLGRDSGGIPTFLDFTAAGSDYAYQGQKILTQEQFVERYHQADPTREFDVFHPLAPVDPQKLHRAAIDQATKTYGMEKSVIGGQTVCSTAAMACLEEATNRRITHLNADEEGVVDWVVAVTPNGFDDPEVVGKFFRKANAAPLRVPEPAPAASRRLLLSRMKLAEDACDKAGQSVAAAEERVRNQEVFIQGLATDSQTRIYAEQALTFARTTVGTEITRRDAACRNLRDLQEEAGQESLRPPVRVNR